MKKFFVGILIGASALVATACTPTQQGASIGAGTGAIIGSVVDDGGLGGTLIGAAVGTAAGALIGRAAEGNKKCYYRDRYGREYTDACPANYR